MRTDEWGKVVNNEEWVSQKTLTILEISKQPGTNVSHQLAISIIEDLKKALAFMTADRDKWMMGAKE